MNWLKNLFASQAFHSFYHAVLACAVAFVTANGFNPSKAWVSGLVAAVLGGVVGWLNGSPAGTNPAVTPSAPAAQGTKITGFFLAFLFLASTANAGYLMPVSKEKMGLSLPSGTAIYLMPIEGFQVGVGLPNPTYGLSLSEDVVWGDMASLNGVPNLAPILGFGLSLYADGAGVINGTGPLLFLGGFNVLGPDLDLLGLGNGQGLVPNVLLTENFVSGETKITGGLTAFVDLGPGTAKKLF